MSHTGEQVGITDSRVRVGTSRQPRRPWETPWESEGIGQSTDGVEREADSERVLDLLARDTGSQHCAHAVCIHRLLVRQLA